MQFLRVADAAQHLKTGGHEQVVDDPCSVDVPQFLLPAVREIVPDGDFADIQRGDAVFEERIPVSPDSVVFGRRPAEGADDAESAAAELQLPQRGFPACFGVFHPQPEGAGYFRPAQNRQDGRVAGIVFQESGQAVGPVLALLQGRHVNDRIDIAVEHSVECPGLPLDFIAG